MYASSLAPPPPRLVYKSSSSSRIDAAIFETTGSTNVLLPTLPVPASFSGEEEEEEEEEEEATVSSARKIQSIQLDDVPPPLAFVASLLEFSAAFAAANESGDDKDETRTQMTACLELQRARRPPHSLLDALSDSRHCTLKKFPVSSDEGTDETEGDDDDDVSRSPSNNFSEGTSASTESRATVARSGDVSHMWRSGASPPVQQAKSEPLEPPETRDRREGGGNFWVLLRSSC